MATSTQTEFEDFLSPGGNVTKHYPTVSEIQYPDVRDYCPFPGADFNIGLRRSEEGGDIARFHEFGVNWDAEAQAALGELRLTFDEDSATLVDTTTKPRLPSGWTIDEAHVFLTNNKTLAHTKIVWRNDDEDVPSFVTAYNWPPW
jgi:hypothetical protein